MFLPFQPPALRGLPSGLEALQGGSGPGGKKGKRNFVFSASSGSSEKNQVNPVIPSENILALCLNYYELISKKINVDRDTNQSILRPRLTQGHITHAS